MKKPKFRKNAQRHLKKKTAHEQKRKEARKQQRVATIELDRLLKTMSPEERRKFLGEDEGEDDHQHGSDCDHDEEDHG